MNLAIILLAQLIKLFPRKADLFPLNTHILAMIIDRLRAKRAHVTFWADLHPLQDRAKFWQTDLPRHEQHRRTTALVDLHFAFEKQRMQKHSVFRAASFGANPSKVDFDMAQT